MTRWVARASRASSTSATVNRLDIRNSSSSFTSYTSTFNAGSSRRRRLISPIAVRRQASSSNRKLTRHSPCPRRCRQHSRTHRLRRRVSLRPRQPTGRTWHLGRCAVSDPFGSGGAGFLLVLVVLVLPEGFLELILENDYLAGSFQSGAVVDHFPGTRGETQLVAGVA